MCINMCVVLFCRIDILVDILWAFLLHLPISFNAFNTRILILVDFLKLKNTLQNVGAVH
jgi:hypothetical protein